MKLPTAVATGVAGDGVRASRAAIVVGAAFALFVFARYGVFEVPTRVLALMAGPSTEIARHGGLHLVYRAPAGVDPREIVERFDARASSIHREGDAFAIDVPRIDAARVDYITKVLVSGGLEMHEVIESEVIVGMKELGVVFADKHGPRSDPWLEIDSWNPEYGGAAHTDYYAMSYSRDRLEAVLARWPAPSGTHYALERQEPPLDAKDRRTRWRTYLLSDEVAIGGDELATAYGAYDPYTNRPVVLLEFTPEGALKFGLFTERIVGKKLATVLAGDVVSAPIINSGIHGGRAEISMGIGDPMQAEAERDALVQALKVGALPKGGEVVSATYVPPDRTPVRIWIGRLALSLVAGLAAGLLAWLAVKLTAPVLRREPELAGDRPVGARLAWTALGIVVAYLGTQIMLPSVNPLELGHLRQYGPLDTSTLSIFSLGIMPAITAFIVVEIVVSLVPRWRALRDGGPDQRARLGLPVAILTVIVVLVQAYFVAKYMQRLRYEVESGHQALIVLSLATGTLVLLSLARMISVRGIGNGFVVLLVAGWLIRRGILLANLHWNELFVAAAAAAAVSVIAIGITGWRVREPGGVAVPLPSSGIVALSQVGGVLALLGLVMSLGVSPDDHLAQWLRDLDHESVAAAALAIMVVVWSLAFARPGRRRELLARSGVAPATRAVWLRAVVASLLALAAMFVIMRHPAEAKLGPFIDPLMLSLAAVLVADMIAEVRARRAGLVAVWPLHDPLLVDVVRDKLAGIPHHLRGARTRSLLWLFGSFAPIEVLVPPEQADAARALLE